MPDKDISSIVEKNLDTHHEEGFNLSSDMNQKVNDRSDLTKESTENSVNFGNLEEKKKTGFFSMLSNLMSSDKKSTEVSDKSLDKSKKAKKTKTDPNLFLFSDIVEDDNGLSNEKNDLTESSEISDISDFSNENDANEDIDTPSYLRKGSNQ